MKIKRATENLYSIEDPKGYIGVETMEKYKLGRLISGEFMLLSHLLKKFKHEFKDKIEYLEEEKEDKEYESPKELKIDLNKWSNLQVQEQIKAIESGVDLSDLDPKKWTFLHMRVQREALENGVNVGDLNPKEWSPDQMKQQMRALLWDLDVSFLNPNIWSAEMMNEHINAISNGIDLSGADPTKWSWLKEEA